VAAPAPFSSKSPLRDYGVDEAICRIDIAGNLLQAFFRKKIHFKQGLCSGSRTCLPSGFYHAN